MRKKQLKEIQKKEDELSRVLVLISKDHTVLFFYLPLYYVLL